MPVPAVQAKSAKVEILRVITPHVLHPVLYVELKRLTTQPVPVLQAPAKAVVAAAAHTPAGNNLTVYAKIIGGHGPTHVQTLALEQTMGLLPRKAVLPKSTR